MSARLDAALIFTFRDPYNTVDLYAAKPHSSRIAFFAYPTCIRSPRYGDSRRNIAIPIGVEKLEWLGYLMMKNFEDIFIRLDATHERDGHTHRETPHAGIGRAYASRGKNRQVTV